MVGISLNQSAQTIGSQDAVAAADSIQSSNADAIAAQRKHRRFDIHLKIIVQPANSIDRAETKWLGECHDISSGGCRVLVQRPLELGSLFWIQFEPSEFSIDPVFARCVRGHLMRENAFEFGMSFLTPIELPAPAQEVESDTDLI
jgi:hypothetical protein